MRRRPARRRAGAVLLLGLGLTALPVPAAAEEPPAASTRCTITDPRLAELSGLVDVGERLLAVVDGGEQVVVHVLDGACAVVDATTAPLDPYDPEDLGVGPDGTVWLADTGDNNATRATVALIALRPDGSTSLHRLAYPDGAHDAEALLLAPDGTPHLVTKEVLGASHVYRPAGPLVDGGTVALADVGTVSFTLTGTPGGPVGRAGQLLVTGGAVARDGSRIALRTYTDAYVWDLAGADVPGALAGEPVRIALPASPQGEAVTFTADGSALLVAGEGVPGDVTQVPIPAATPAAPAAPATATGPSLSTLLDDGGPGPSAITAALVAAGVATLLVVVGGRVRRRRAPRPPGA
ncbi:hypothetical protein SAMN05660464_0160 [Geodermatophilus dictyosporus]|uniref:Uncharacterized protein n=1 Tax=Geodermatophilus dictyosporus TaxID=1523247 RepID=A0A1I5U937_9ACTN|nr:hypothetical protein [Geodermatophilus dictyosporus]SFP91793.1 hypothetical protein SAMN05660464_0160 [Geodermatophilus dictyosporus]